MIIRPFNLTFFLLIVIDTLIIIGSTFIFKNKKEKVKNYFVLSLCGLNLILFVWYKIELSKDPNFNFNIYNELPLQLCNINMMLLPIGIIFKKDWVKAFAVYFGVLGALMALCFPEPNFMNNSIFLARNIGYYGTHSLLIINGTLAITLGMFKPNFKVIPKMVIFLVGLCLVILVIDLVLSKVTNTDVNYFFILNPAGVGVLEMFYNLIKVPFIYGIIPMGFMVGLIYLVTIPFEYCYKNGTQKKYFRKH